MKEMKLVFLFLGLFNVLAAIITFLFLRNYMITILSFCLLDSAVKCLFAYAIFSNNRQAVQSVDSSNSELLYQSPLSQEECIFLLNAKNIYDTREYQFETDSASQYYITFWSRSATVYRVEFIQHTDACFLFLSLAKEKMLIPLSTIPYPWIDAFMEKKLEAKRIPKKDRVEFMNTHTAANP